MLHFSVNGFNLKNIILLAILLVATVVLFFGGNNASFEKTIAVRIKISMTTIMAFFGVILLFMSGNVLMNGLIFIVLSILLSYAFSYMGNTGWANLFLILFLLLVFANQYYFKFL